MRFSYRLVRQTSGWLAECMESDAAGEGKTESEAVASLRTALEERMFRPDAVAPPEEANETSIILVLAEETSFPL